MGGRLGQHRAALGLMAVALLFITVLRHGWLSDDAFISLRAVVHWVDGYGLVSNVGERVQGFSNPLWTLLLGVIYALIRDVYFVPIGLSLVCVIGLGLLLTRRRDAGWAVVLAPLLLSLSLSFVHFSTSGLENPLAHLLLAAFCVERLRDKPSAWRSWLLVGLLGFNRLDHLLLVAPVMALYLDREIRRRGARASLKPALLGLAPLLGWFGFATLYYGSPLPNPAFAKLNANILRSDLLGQGLAYLIDIALRDPLVLLVLLAAFGLAIRDRRRGPARPLLAAGVLLYLVYVVYVGGDFMFGRFLTAPYLIAVVLVADGLTRLGPGPVAVVAGAAVLLGKQCLEPLPTDPTTACIVPLSGIVDERACYVEHTGIAQSIGNRWRQHPYYRAGRRFREQPQPVVHIFVGIGGLAAGSGVHLIDEHGLTDPLLARMRFEPAGRWRIGHFRRPIPQGYVETVASGQNHLEDPCLREMWERLSLVTRGPILTAERLKAIWQLNVSQRTCPTPR